MYAREFPAAQLTEEAIWLFGNEAIQKLAPNRSAAPSNATAQSVAFPDGGIYILAASQPFAQIMAVDAGPQGVGRSGHGHADALSVRLTMDGRRWLVDSGSGVYISKDPATRNAFRGTSAHNTLRVDGVDQAVPDEAFSWTNIPTTRVENWIVGKSFTYFVGSHNGYERLADPVVHRRHVLKIAGDLWLVRDVAIGKVEHELEIRWHFAPDLEVDIAGPGRIEVSRVGVAHPSFLSLVVPQETVWQTSLEANKNLLSPSYGMFQPGPLVSYSARVLLPAETATALIPQCGIIRRDGEPNIQPRLTSKALPAVQAYELDYHGRSNDFFFALSHETWSSGPWTSDARALYCRTEKDKLAHLVVIDGTHVVWQGQPLLKALGKSNFFEWSRQNAVMNASSSEVSVTSLIEQLTGEHWTTEEMTGGARSSPVDVSPTSSPYAEKH
jgi:hypothetical protein